MAILENLTIMFTDIVGFSDKVTKLSRNASERLLHKHDRILKKVIRRFRGKIVKSIGDSFLVVFRSPTDAVLCGMAMQDALWEANQCDDNIEPIAIRVAINAGEVRLAKHDVFGDAVNIAARLEQVTPSGAVYLTKSVYLTMNKSEVKLARVDEFQFKGIDERIAVYAATFHCADAQATAVDGVAPSQQADSEVSVYPFGGAHIYQRSHNRRRPQHRLVVLLLLLLPLCVALTWWLTLTFTPIKAQEKILVDYSSPPADGAISQSVDILSNAFIVRSHILNKTGPLLQEGNFLGLQSLVDEYAQQYADEPYLLLLQAHIHMYFKRYRQAQAYYRKALDGDMTLASDAMTAKNLVRLLEHERKAANRLIARNLSPEMVRQLGLRTGQAGLRARYDAFYLLKDSGNAQAIDLVGLNSWDLRELDKCQLRKTAVIELKRLGDKRALLPLKEALKLGLFGRIKYACLYKEAQAAVASIEARNATQ